MNMNFGYIYFELCNSILAFC